MLNDIINYELQLISKIGCQLVIFRSLGRLGMITHCLDASLHNVVPVRIVNQSQNMAVKRGNELGEILVVNT
jgi:hypothetical protein